MKFKKNYKKILLALSLLPYFVFLVLGIVNCTIQNSKHDYFYFDIYDLFQPLGDFWLENMRGFNMFWIIIVLFAIAYPIYFVIDFFANKNEIKQKEENIEVKQATINVDAESKPKLKKGFIFFLISFIPYLSLVFSSIFGIDFFGKVYGFAATFLILILFTYLPIFPVLAIFQLIYFIRNRKTFSKKCKIITLSIVVGILVAGILIPCCIHEAIKVIKTENNYEAHNIQYETDENKIIC